MIVPSPQNPAARSVVVCALALLLSAPAGAEPEEVRGPPPSTVAPIYEVERFEIRYANAHPRLPAIAEVAETEVLLARSGLVYTAPAVGLPEAKIRLTEVFETPSNRFDASAILAVDQAVVAELNRRGFVAVMSVPDERDVSPRTGADLRAGERGRLRLVIYVGRVTEVHTFASGDRIRADERLDNPRHAPIAYRSPVKPDGLNDLLDKETLDEFTARLSRHPGRRVDVLVSPATEPGGARLDLLVSEHKPWFLYAGITNTGTSSTTKWRQRIGFTHTQLMNRDDVLSIDYVTGDFDEVHAGTAYYEAPVWGHPWMREHVRVRTTGTYLEYDASVLGFDDTFEGDAWSFGSDMLVNVFQHGDFFLDLMSGFRFSVQHARDNVILTEGEARFLLPRAGLRAQRLTDTSAFALAIDIEANLGKLITDKSEQAQLGRVLVDRNWQVLRFDASGSFYLEPLLYGTRWEDPETWETSTLAHEIHLALRGQYAFDKRLVPTEMGVAGGLYTVRGYREAAASGDTTVIGTLEYRLHVPRLLRPRPPMRLPLVGPFRHAPSQVYGQPDWDLIARGFLDVGHTIRSQPIGTETDETLIGLGVGLELRLSQNFSLRADYGLVLHDLELQRKEDVGDGRAHVSARILY